MPLKKCFIALLTISLIQILVLPPKYVMAQSNAETQSQKQAKPPLHQDLPSSAETVAVMFHKKIGEAPDMAKLAFANLTPNASKKDVASEVNRLSDIFSTTDLRYDYITIHDITSFETVQGEDGGYYFILKDVTEDYMHEYRYQDKNYAVMAQRLAVYNRIKIDQGILEDFVRNYNGDNQLGFTLKVKTKFADNSLTKLNEDKEYYFLGGEIAYFAVYDYRGKRLYEEKAPWMGVVLEDEIKSLYHKDRKITEPEMRKVDSEIRDLYKAQ